MAAAMPISTSTGYVVRSALRSRVTRGSPTTSRAVVATAGTPTTCSATLSPMAEVAERPLDQRLEEIGAQLAWVRDYL